jgi:hypothetical protein
MLYIEQSLLITGLCCYQRYQITQPEWVKFSVIKKIEVITKVKHADYQPPHRLLSKMFFVGSDYQSLTVFYSLIESKTY